MPLFNPALRDVIRDVIGEKIVAYHVQSYQISNLFHHEDSNILLCYKLQKPLIPRWTVQNQATKVLYIAESGLLARVREVPCFQEVDLPPAWHLPCPVHQYRRYAPTPTPAPHPLLQVRSLTTNFQRLLTQATKEIKKLTQEKLGLEQEQVRSHLKSWVTPTSQEKLLTVNVELALETKCLLEQQKEWGKQEAVSEE